MKQKHVLALAIVAPFLTGVLVTLIFTNPRLTGSDIALQGSVLSGTNGAPLVCRDHDECPQGSVCRYGECVPAERSFCSQPFMLAHALEGRFIRYTLCNNRCVRSGESAYCE